jgi:hypothetical protein
MTGSRTAVIAFAARDRGGGTGGLPPGETSLARLRSSSFTTRSLSPCAGATEATSREKGWTA